jgi:hypothetical protein
MACLKLTQQSDEFIISINESVIPSASARGWGKFVSKLKVSIKNGYGIGAFDKELPFDASSDHPQQNTNIIYAQNGVMKSSFTRTVRDHSRGIDVKDHIFDLPGKCQIIDDSGTAFPPDAIISIPSFDSEAFRCEDMSALLVNSKRREEYDALMEQYNEAYDVFIGRLKNLSGVSLRTTPEELLDIVCPVLDQGVDPTPEALIRLIRSVHDQIERQPDFILKLPYSVAGSVDAQKFADTNQSDIAELMKAYDEVKTSASFVRGGFDTGNAQSLAKEIEKSKFFDVNHDVELFNNATQELEKVTDIDDLKAKLATDIDVVLSKYPDLRKKFDKMITDLSTASRAGLKQLLEGKETKEIITLMNNSRMYKRRLWWGYIKGCLDEFNQLEAVGKDIEGELKDIVEQAKNESTEWDRVVRQFNDRFRNLPYHIEIENKSNVILKDGTPELTLVYRHPLHSPKFFRERERDTLIGSRLSTGERKAFYLLNVMFEIETAQQSGNDHLVVLDDIVDSFDYKNKYAFLEYLYDISTKYNHIKLIILTHNFDFFRLLQLRLFGEGYRDHTWFAQKQGNEVALTKGGQFNIIKDTREKAPRDPVMWLALIPFARNLIEYKSPDITMDADYRTLTECLHSIDVPHAVADVQRILCQELGVSNSPMQPVDDVETELLKAAEAVYGGTDAEIIIQRNLVLAMASRRLAERYMKSKMTQANIDAAKNEGKDFTRRLFVRFVTTTTPTDDVKTLLDRVNLVTPEHIHVNSFMYEPLIDLGLDELKQLYGEMKTLNGIS